MAWWEPLGAWWQRKKWERLHFQAACKLLESSPSPVLDDEDARRWKLVGSGMGKEGHLPETEQWRDTVSKLIDTNPFARNALTLHRNYVVGTGMRHEVIGTNAISDDDPRFEDTQVEDTTNTSSDATTGAAVLGEVERLWHHFLLANQWDTGQRKDWEFCVRTWRDGECFVRLFRSGTWPPRLHFVDPERVAPDPASGLPTDGIATEPNNVEVPTGYLIHHEEGSPELVAAERILHCKIGVDGNVKRGISLFLPVIEALQKYQGWLEVELLHRKLVSSIVLVRKHQGQSPGSIAGFADWTAQQSQPTGKPISPFGRYARVEPGTIIDSQGYDLQYLSPDGHFDDSSILGRRLLLAVAAGVGLPEFMLSADAGNANYSSTLVAEGPAVRHFAAWQAFFIGQWQRLFRMVMAEAVRVGLLASDTLMSLSLKITPPALAVRNREMEAQADALYYDRGALSQKELARRDQADPEAMQRERAVEMRRGSELASSSPQHG